ncbi:hypothetical protein B0J17DRAFT_684075 [Rhizoctonia solani]|nr:hypothetical protein B0J17DRAFT_684075 [Rhizoctonia solani]
MQQQGNVYEARVRDNSQIAIIGDGNLCLELVEGKVLVGKQHPQPANASEKQYEWNHRQLWKINEYAVGKVKHVTIRNIKTGDFLAHDGRSLAVIPTEGKPYTEKGRRAFTLRNGQLWIVSKPDAEHHNGHSIQNVQTKAYINFGTRDVPLKPHHQVQALEKPSGNHWVFYKKSVTLNEVYAILKAHGKLHPEFKVADFVDDSLYLVVTQGTLVNIWEQTGLGRKKCRMDIWDSDDFAISFKNSVSTWGDNEFEGVYPGFGILCGIAFARNKDPKQPAHAYSWTLHREGNTWKIIYFEPQNGKFDTEALRNTIPYLMLT